eukprot:2553877-Prymnesium_polylepis.1
MATHGGGSGAHRTAAIRTDGSVVARGNTDVGALRGRARARPGSESSLSLSLPSFGENDGSDIAAGTRTNEID